MTDQMSHQSSLPWRLSDAVQAASDLGHDIRDPVLATINTNLYWRFHKTIEGICPHDAGCVTVNLDALAELQRSLSVMEYSYVRKVGAAANVMRTLNADSNIYKRYLSALGRRASEAELEDLLGRLRGMVEHLENEIDLYDL